METVFISSVMRGFEAVRAAARDGVESIGMRPVMAESAGAHPESPQTALLDLVAQSDVYLLLLGPRYGDAGASGVSPTEEEFSEAKRLGKPIIVLRQNVALDPEQEAFLTRATGGWETGRMYDRFDGHNDVHLKAIHALSNLRQAPPSDLDLQAAQGRALELASTANRSGYRSGAHARIAIVPVVRYELMDDLQLEDRELEDDLVRSVRDLKLVPQSTGVAVRRSSAGLELVDADPSAEPAFAIVIGRDGAVAVEGPVEGRDSHFAGMRIDPDRLRSHLVGAGLFARTALGRLDPTGRVRSVAVTTAIPDGANKVYGLPAQPTNALSMGGMVQMPAVVMAPSPARAVRVADLGGEEEAALLVAALRRIYADAGSIEEGA